MRLRLLFVLALAVPAGCAIQPPAVIPTAQIEVTFSPEAGSEKLVLKVIGSARQSIRLAGYSFTSPVVVRGLIEAKRRGVDVRVLVDDRGNRSQASIAALNLLLGAEIPTRVISTYAIHHDKYIVVDGRHTQTGSFNYSQAAAKSNSENVLTVWDNPSVASLYLAHWESRWAQGILIDRKY
ncbi:phospholipase D family protein [Polaromonas sp. JS666]|uniref:phospholipase D family nuclease n=1 Tax=Polaromonas sp. (strain JS666 / ATCC BAA-500) TaxID=296591 RepID=UPI00005316D3|nr:phospholipase D family protein [Polaromonas sp. JS666]ABE43861.1 Phospholipase D/Transphosphatidylase [Polaromonas sp. JS666]